MENVADFDFQALKFNEQGAAAEPNVVNDFVNAAGAVTDVVLIAHGFRNSEQEARDLYTEFLTNFRKDLVVGDLATRKWLVGAVLWPSKAFKEAVDLRAEGGVLSADEDGAAEAERAAAKALLDDMAATLATGDQKQKLEQAKLLLDQLDSSPAKQNDFVNLVRSLLEGSESDPNEAIGKFQAAEGSKILDTLQAPIIIPPPDGDTGDGGALAVDGDAGGGTQGVTSVVSSVFGAVGQFLNMTTWYVMKNRCGAVGANGVAEVVRKLKAAHPTLKVHLVGHSLGGRLVTSCAKSLGTANALDSLNLLEAAFSHYGFTSSLNGDQGFFRKVFDAAVVRGPVIATYSAQDSVVGLAYSMASRIAKDNTQAIGDENDPYGGIGRNGSQNFPAAARIKLNAHGVPYAAPFAFGKLTNLNGSGGLIKDHGDVRNPAVTWAVAHSISRT